MISVLHTAANAPSLVTYNDVAGFFQFRGLSPRDRVHLRMVNGIVDFDNCQRATIVAEQIYPGRHPQSKKFNTTLRVRGKDQALPKDGFLGIMTMFNAGNPYDITVEDSQSLVISDYYTEQTERVLLLKGNSGDAPGRCTFLAHKFQGFAVADMAHVRFDRAQRRAFLPLSLADEPRPSRGVGLEKLKQQVSHLVGAGACMMSAIGAEVAFLGMVTIGALDHAVVPQVRPPTQPGRSSRPFLRVIVQGRIALELLFD